MRSALAVSRATKTFDVIAGGWLHMLWTTSHFTKAQCEPPNNSYYKSSQLRGHKLMQHGNVFYMCLDLKFTNILHIKSRPPQIQIEFRWFWTTVGLLSLGHPSVFLITTPTASCVRLFLLRCHLQCSLHWWQELCSNPIAYVWYHIHQRARAPLQMQPGPQSFKIQFLLELFLSQTALNLWAKFNIFGNSGI